MTDFRALCAELLQTLESWSPSGGGPLEGKEAEIEACLINRARAALTEPAGSNLPESPDSSDGPAVSDDRKPAPVTDQPTDENIMELMPQQMRDDLAAAARALAGFTGPKASTAYRIILNRHAVDHARAALAKWGHQ